MLPVSLEAIEDLAVRVRAAHVALYRAALEGAPLPPVALPDASRLPRAYALARATDPALGVLVAEAVALDALRIPSRAWEAAWAQEPIALAGEDPLPVRALPTALALEPNAHRRAALMARGDARARDHLLAARAVVDALRNVGTTLGLDTAASLHGALGLGEPDVVERGADAVLAATEDAWRELEAWARPRVGLSRVGELSWADRQRTLASPRATELIPLGDRTGIASRWIARTGLPDALTCLRDDARRPSATGVGVRALCERPGERVVVAGTPQLHAAGAVALTGAVAEGLSLLLAREERPALRLGSDRVHHAVAEALGRRLFLEPVFVVREAAVDRTAREPVLLECLYAELFAMRLDAALSRFALDALNRAPDLPARLREAVMRATGSAPAPAWAAHLAAQALELRPGARTLAALLETHVRDGLRERHDEDWFRNPRAGESLRTVMTAMRAQGALAWAAGGQGLATALDPAPLARRVADALHAARR
jgi:hypothetical protein